MRRTRVILAAVPTMAALLIGGAAVPAQAVSEWIPQQQISPAASADSDANSVTTFAASADASVVTAFWVTRNNGGAGGGGGEIWSNRTTDTGATWSEPVRISAVGSSTTDASDVSAVATPDGQDVTAVWRSWDRDSGYVGTILSRGALNGQWDGEPTRISADPVSTANKAGAPTLAASEDGSDIVVAWTASNVSDKSAVASAVYSAEDGWGSAVQISADAGPQSNAYTEPRAVMSADGTTATVVWGSRVQYQSSPNRWAVEVRGNTFANGAWGTNVLISAPAAAATAVADDAPQALLGLADGTVMAAWLSSNAIFEGTILASAFDGSTWTAPASVSAAASLDGNFAASSPALAEDSSGVTATWNAYPSQGAYANRFTGGASGTWGTDTQISTADSLPAALGSPVQMIASPAGPGTTAAWRVTAAGEGQIWTTRFDGTWSEPVNVSGTAPNAYDRQPVLAASADGSIVSIAWNQVTGDIGQMFATSSTGGVWAPAPFSALGSAAANPKYQPSLISSANGSRLVATWIQQNTDSQGQIMSSSRLPIPAPTLTAISPASGSASGGDAVTLTGTGFRQGATVTVGGVACSAVSVVDSSTIMCTTGAHAAGAADVTVTNSDTQFATLAGAFTFVSATPDQNPQTAPAPPAAIKSAGRTVVNKAGAVTSQGQPVTAQVSSRGRSLSTRGDVVCLRKIKGNNRKLTLVTTGNCRLRVQVTYTAPATAGFAPYHRVVTYKTKIVR